MNKTILVLLTFFLMQNVFCQFALNNVPFDLKNPPSNSYKIIQTKENELIRVEEVNQNGDIIFKYSQTEIPPFFSWKEPHRFIYAYEYDDYGQLIKSYAFNSNSGHALYEYVFDSATNTKTTYERYYPTPDSLKNANAFANISRINCFEDLIKSTEVAILFNSVKKFVKLEYLNEKGQVYRVRSLDPYEKDSVDTYNLYDSENRELSIKVVLSSGEIEREIISEYPNDSTEITTVVKYRNGEINSKYKHAVVTTDKGGIRTEYFQSGGTLDIRQYYYMDGYLVKIMVYETKYKNEIIVPVSMNLKLIAEIKYQYNPEGLFEKEVMNNYQTGERKSNVYNYRIESIK